MDGWMHGQIDGQDDEWMNEQMGCWMDGQVNGQIHIWTNKLSLKGINNVTNVSTFPNFNLLHVVPVITSYSISVE